MRFLPALTFLAFLALFSSRALCEAYEGGGPDAACEGTLLRVELGEKEAGKITYVLFMSMKVVAQEYVRQPGGAWKLTVKVSPSQTAMELPGGKKEPSWSETFDVKDKARGAEVTKRLEFEKMNWAKEPGRLLGYFKKHRKEFEPAPAGG